MNHLPVRSMFLVITVIAVMLAVLLRLFNTIHPDPIQAAWQRAQAAGSYAFTADIIQTTTPSTSVMNVGRQATHQQLFLAGHTDIRAETMQLRLWSESGSVQQLASGIEVEVKASEVRVRQGDGAWRQVDDFTTAIAPGGDFLSFIQTTQNATATTPRYYSGQTFERYTFTLDGAALATMMRDHTQQQLSNRGELPPGLTLTVPQQISKATGVGELWVNDDGLPARQEVTLTFPAEEEEQQTVHMVVEFANFGTDSTADFWGSLPFNATVTEEFLLHTVLPLLLVLVFATMLVVLGRGWGRSGVIIGLCLVIVLGPSLLQGRTIHFGVTQAAQASEQERARSGQESQQNAARLNPQATFDPHMAPLATIAPPLPISSGQATPAAQTDDGTDQDGDGLTDWQELRIGTIYSDTIDVDEDGSPDLFGADTDGDEIPDTNEVLGFDYAGKTWHTDPLAADSNGDGLPDAAEWGSDAEGNVLSVPIDTDGDDTPDLFDFDNDGDGVPDDLDLAPFSLSSETYHEHQRFGFSLDNLEADAPTLVQVQLRPEDADHLWFAQSVLDWPDNDRQGQIQDDDGATLADLNPDEPLAAAQYGDTRLIPLLEVTLPEINTNLPLLDTPRVSLALEPLAESSVRGEVVLEQKGADLHVQSTFAGDTELLHLIEAENCTALSAAAIENATDTISATGGVWADTLLEDQERLLLVASYEDEPVACTVVPFLVFDGERMIDQDALLDYGLTVRDVAEDGSGKVLYAPLQLQTDATTGAHVAFSGQLLYQPDGGLWGDPHQVRLVWAVQTLVDRCALDGYEDNRCTTFESYNQPQIIHVYDDPWILTGFSAREERGADLAVIYEDPERDQTADDLANNDALVLLARGLEENFPYRSDLTVADLRDRFDYTANSDATPEESWGFSETPAINRLRVETSFYPSRDDLLRDTATRLNQQILEEVFGPHQDRSTPEDLVALLMYARRERHRTLDLDLVARQAWQNQTLAIDFAGVGVSEYSALNWVPFRDEGGGWEALDGTAFWELIAERYPVEELDYLSPEAREGEQLLIQLFHLSLYSGISGLTQAYGVVVEPLLLLSDDEWYREADRILTDVNNVLRTIIDDITYLIGGYLSMLAQKQQSSKGLEEVGVNQAEASAGFGKRLNNRVKEGFKFVNKRPAFAVTGRAQTNTVKMLQQVAGTVINLVGILLFIGTLIVLGVPQVRNLAFNNPAAKGITLSFVALLLTYYGILRPIQEVVILSRTVGNLFSFFIDGWRGSITSLDKRFLPWTTLKAQFKALVWVTIITTLIITAVQVGLFIYWVEANNVDTASVQFTQGLAYLFASITLVILLAAIGLIPIVGQIIVAVYGLVDLILTFYHKKSLSEYVIQGILPTIYGLDLMVAIDDLALRDTDIEFKYPEKGIVVGNSFRYRTTIDTTIRHEKPAQRVWQARFYTYLWDRPALRGTTVAFELDDAERNVDADYGTMRKLWGNYKRVGKFGVTPLEQAAYTTTIENEELPLQKAGMNTALPVYLNFGAALPAVECWTVPVPNPFLVPPAIPVPVCYRRQVSGGESLHIGAGTVIDVLPATLDDFYELRASGDGQRLAWDKQFATLPDADGDGLLSLEYGGLDPNDAHWDIDGDGLSDAAELQLRQQGVAVELGQADTDSDGLNDLEEIRAGTNPARPDSDNDQLSDWEEVQGWTVTVGGATDLTIHVTSNPLQSDADGDGISDRAERDLAAAGKYYHPEIFNPNPLAIYPSIDDGDGVLRPGQTFVYTTTVLNTESDVPFYAPALQVTLPEAVAGDIRTAPLNFSFDDELEQQVAVNVQQLTIPAGTTAQTTTLTSDVRVRTAPVSSMEQLVVQPQAFDGVAEGRYAALALSHLAAPQAGYLMSSVSVGPNRSPGPVRLRGTGEAESIARDLASAGYDGSDVACANNGYCMVVWGEGDRPNRFSVHGIVLAPDGTLFKGPFQISGSAYIEAVPRIASDGDDFAVVWGRSRGGSPPNFEYDIVARTYDWRGEPTDSDPSPIVLSPTSKSRPDRPRAWLFNALSITQPPAIVWAGNRYVVAWGSSAYGIGLATLYNRQTSLQLINPTPTGETYPAVAYNPARQEVLLVFEQDQDGGSTLVGVALDIAGSTLGTALSERWTKTLDTKPRAGRANYYLRPQITYNPMNNTYLVGTFRTDYLPNSSHDPGRYYPQLFILDDAGNTMAEDTDLVAPGQYIEYPRQHDVVCPALTSVPQLNLMFENPGDTTTFNGQSLYEHRARCDGDNCPTAGIFARPEGVTNSGSEFALFFDGTNDRLDVDRQFQLNIAGEITIAAWLRPATADGIQTIIARGSPGTAYTFLRINGGNYEVGAEAFGTTSLVRSQAGEATADIGAWVHLAGVYDGSQWRLYRNGQEMSSVTSGNRGGALATVDSTWRIGSAPNGSQAYHGAIDDLRLYSVGLRPADLAELQRPTTATAPSCLFAGAFKEALFARNVTYETLTTRGGRIENAADFTFTIDTERPTVQSIGLKNGQYFGPERNTAVILGGTAHDDVAIANVEVRIDGGDWQLASGTEAWVTVLRVDQLAAGEHTLEVRATDAAGLTSVSTQPVTFIVDRTAPIVTVDFTETSPENVILAPEQNAAGQWFITLQGTVDDPKIDTHLGSGVQEVAVLLEGQGTAIGNDWQVATVIDNTWQLDYIFPDFTVDENPLSRPGGLYNLRLRAIDRVGNVTRTDPPGVVAPRSVLNEGQGILVQIDGFPPTAALTNPAPDTASLTQTLTLHGVVSDTGIVKSGVQSLDIAFRPAEQASLLSDPALFLSLPLNQVPVTGRVLSTVGSGTDATCSDPVCPTAIPDGRLDGAARFDGIDDRLTANLQNSPVTSITLALWVQTNCADCGVLSAMPSAANESPGLQLFLEQGDLCVQSGTDAPLCTSGTTLDDEQWQHVVYVFDGTDAVRQLWINGSMAAQDSGGSSLFKAQTLVLGEASAAQHPAFAGALDAVYQFERVLMPHEIETLRQTADLRWYAANLGAVNGEDIVWALELPSDLEGLYQLEARPVDRLGNQPLNPQALWRGEIDTQAPRLTLTPTYSSDGLDVWANYRCIASDLNLDEASVSCPEIAELACPIDTRGYDISLWYQETLGTNTRLTEVQASCSGQIAAGSVPTLSACDVYGHCANLAGPAAAPDSLQAVVVMPATDTLLTTTAPTRLSVLGGSPDGLQRLELLLDGVVVASETYADSTVGARLEHEWQPRDNQLVLVQARATDQTGAQVTSEPVSMQVQTALPTVTLSTTTILTTVHQYAPQLLPLTGAVSPGALVDIQLEGQPSQRAAITGRNWRLLWALETALDGVSVPMVLRATDQAERQTTVEQTVLVDTVPPQPVTAQIIASTAQGQQIALVEGQQFGREVTQLSLMWDASQDGSGVAGYAVQWSTDPLPDKTTMQWIEPADDRQFIYSLPILQNHTEWYAHLLIADQHGNEHIQSFGPVVHTSEPAPLLGLTKTGALVVDQNGDGQLSPGDTVEWQLILSNPGNGPLQDWLVQDMLTNDSMLVVGSVVSSAGQIQIEPQTLTVTGATLAAGDTVTVRFRTRLDPNLSSMNTVLRNQATAQAVDYTITGSDNPATLLFGDATELAILHPQSLEEPEPIETPEVSEPPETPADEQQRVYLPSISLPLLSSNQSR